MIEAASVSFGYGTGAVLDRVDLRIGSGLTLLVGPNGCGKSTLLKLLAGVERPDEGRVTIAGHDLWRDEMAARRHLVYVPEHPDLTPYASLLEIMRLVCRLRAEPLERAMQVLDGVGLADRVHASVRELSAGQRRRALLAAAWIGTPQVALLDEPLEWLDRHLRSRVLCWIGRLVQDGGTVVVVSHQVGPLLALAGFAASVRDRRVVGPVVLPADADRRLSLVESLAG